MFALTIIQGEQCARRREAATGAVRAAVRSARHLGLVVGRRVRLGSITGRVIGYNIAAAGVYPGAVFPLLVATEYGVAKCSTDEIRLIR